MSRGARGFLEFDGKLLLLYGLRRFSQKEMQLKEPFEIRRISDEHTFVFKLPATSQDGVAGTYGSTRSINL